MPELPEARRQRYTQEHKLSNDDAYTLVETKEMGDFFDRVLALNTPAKDAANFLLNTTNAYLKENKLDFSELKLTPEHLRDLQSAVAAGTISRTAAKDVLVALMQEGGNVTNIIQAKGLAQLSDEAGLREAVSRVLESSPAQVAEFQSGKTKVRQYFFGEVMKQTKGKANPAVVNKLLDELLAKP
jgi:aspartyl-tRNA(Asn)/glutamyl-tRNA(Gln) amidotransferase subunit B